ncbi:uncharacterized protein N0V89_009250 [Didymosphaeria variabile]|uniref:Cupredoxin n=1 Tax=Didymosphaeria variabile TaxID=1932322 RepID=A0A9W9C729_9PLEO|nr:uncharacterized protein N0V89_009250 [Didymosphaeria variabile]KAJ4347878.1 hypothetical protein N0V89_009250 [Didymosphaeria variabile]
MSTPSATATDVVPSGSRTSTVSAEITSAPTDSSSISASVTSSSNSSSSSRPPQVYTVKAGAGGFKFDPPELKDVNVGDTVTFEFYPPDHSVARAEFESACVPYEYTGKGKTGFWSDTQWVKDVDHLTYFNVTVNSTEPIFYYCGAPDSCIGHQMVGVINPNDTQTLDKQIIAAKDATFMVKPGDPIPAEASASLHASATATAAPSSHSGHTLSGGAIAGIVVGGIAFLAICAALFFYVGRTKSLKEVIKHREAVKSPAPTDGHFPHSPGYSPLPFSPNMQHAEMGMGGQQLPAYGQHNATDSHYNAYAHQGSPQPQ